MEVKNLCILLLIVSSVFTFPFIKKSITHGVLDEFMNKPTKDLFKVYHFIFDKSTEYELNSEEGIRRYRIFKQNLKEIKEHNAKKLSWTEGINQFTDLTVREFKEKYLMNEEEIKQQQRFLKSVSLDDYDDENDEILFPDTKNVTLENFDHMPYMPFARLQQECKSSWAMACAAAIETNFAKDFELDPFYLSPQQLIDCSPYNNFGCDGGNVRNSMQYILDEGGLVKEEDYLYKAKQGACKIPVNATKFGITNYVSTEKKPLAKWHENVSKGAAYVVIDARAIMRYSGGIIKFSESNTKCEEVNYALTASSFFTLPDGKHFLVFKNSWGTRWGEFGYMAAYYEEENDTCFLTKYSYRPIPKKQ